MEEASVEVSRHPQSSSRDTLIPSGFESVAHPVFFRTIDFPRDSSPRSTRRQQETSSTTITTTINATPTAARNIDALDIEGNFGTGAGPDRGAGNNRSNDERSLREVPSVCPICLEKFERPVTLTSCLHTFCHTCILGWYEHTVAVALSRGDLAAFSPESGGMLADRIISNRGEGAGSTSSTSSRGNKPYRCPLCQVPGPFFLAVERPRYKSKKSPCTTPPKLRFKLLGARTVFGGAGERSGGVAVDEHRGGQERIGDASDVVGYPSPSMADLRAAAQTQHALAFAAREGPAKVRPKETSRPSPAGERGEVAAGGDDGVVRERLSSLGAAQHVAIGDQAESSRPTRSDEGSGDGSGGGGGSSGNRAGGVGGDAAGDTAVARLGGGVVGADDEPRAAPQQNRLEDRSPLPLDQGEIRSQSPSGRRQDRTNGRSRPASRDGGERGRRKRRRRSEEGDEVALDFRVIPAVGRGAPNSSSGASGELLGRGRSNCSTSSTNGRSSRSGSADIREDYTDGMRSAKKRRKRKRQAREEAWKDEMTSASCSSSNGSLRRCSSDGHGKGVESGGARRAGRAANSGGLLWEPGAMPAEDGLEAIEALLAKEKESLRRKTVGGGGLPL